MSAAHIIFTRDSIYAIARICYHPSVRRYVDHRKTVEVRIIKFSPYGSPILLVFAGKFHPEILTGSPRAGASNEGGVGNSLRSTKTRSFICYRSISDIQLSVNNNNFCHNKQRLLNQQSSIFKREDLKNGTSYGLKLQLMTNRKLHMGFPLTQGSNTLDDLELL